MSYAERAAEIEEALARLNLQTELYLQENTSVSRILAEALKSQIEALEVEAARFKTIDAIKKRTRQKFLDMPQIGENVAAECRYRVHLLLMMREQGLLHQVAHENSVPMETLELYTARATFCNLACAIEAQIQRNVEPLNVDLENLANLPRPRWTTKNRTSVLQSPHAQAERRLLIRGFDFEYIRRVSGSSFEELDYVYRNLTPLEHLQRVVVRKAKTKKSVDDIHRLRAMGFKLNDIAARVGRPFNNVCYILYGKK